MQRNYHTHTYRCGHAVGSEREYVEKAIELGFTELGFSEHAPMPFPDNLPKQNLDRLLAMRLKLHETEDYIESLLSLREEMDFELWWDGACGKERILENAPKGMDGFVLGTTLLFDLNKLLIFCRFQYVQLFLFFSSVR